MKRDLQIPGIQWDHSFLKLPRSAFTEWKPVPVAKARLVAWNESLAEELGINSSQISQEELAEIFSGNGIPQGAHPVAFAYAGHQFGHFVPQLGDGRAILLGEALSPEGKRFDIQFKGSGITPYSRDGDGRCPLGPALREFVVSEAMHALGIPTTRSLAVVETGEKVYREEALAGAVLTRVASSHIRVGSFEYFKHRGDEEGLRSYTAYVIQRHDSGATRAECFKRVIERQAKLIARWMSVGFIHGVMNTDNMLVSGETIDYGPCAFMDEFHWDQVYSSIDRHGRYAYSNQPRVAKWNLYQLGKCLFESDEDEMLSALNEFDSLFESEFTRLLQTKVGEGKDLQEVLTAMERDHSDFTLTFRSLSPESNPLYIPRNHLVEKAITSAYGGDYAFFHRLCDRVRDPFRETPGDEDLATPPRPEERVHATFCGT